MIFTYVSIDLKGCRTNYFSTPKLYTITPNVRLYMYTDEKMKTKV